MRSASKRVTLVFLCCTLGAIVFYGWRTLLASEVADIPALEISPLGAGPCSMPNEDPIIVLAPTANYTRAALKKSVSGNEKKHRANEGRVGH